jgi:hypothetical protein
MIIRPHALTDNDIDHGVWSHETRGSQFQAQNYFPPDICATATFSYYFFSKAQARSVLFSKQRLGLLYSSYMAIIDGHGFALLQAFFYSKDTTGLASHSSLSV